MSDVPIRGDVINIDFRSQKGLEIQKVRPALVLSTSAFNRLNNTIVVCPITSQNRRSEFLVEIESDHVEGVYTKNVRDDVDHSFIVANLFTTMKWEPGKLYTKNSREPGNVWCYLCPDVVDNVCFLVDRILNQKETDPDFIPLQGAVVKFEETSSSEYEFALVLSASELNYWKRLFTICPISPSSIDSRLAVEIPDTQDTEEARIKKYYILADQVKSWDWWNRKAAHQFLLPDPTFKDVCKIVRAIIWGALS